MTKTYANHKGLKSALSTPPNDGHEETKDVTATGLYLRVYSTGLGVFVHRYKINSVRRVFILPLPELSKASKESELSSVLAQARAIHAQQRTQIKAGIDPAIERDLKAQELITMPTVAEFAETYIKRYAQPKKKTWAEDKRQLDKDVLPAIGSVKLDKVKRSQLISLLDRKQDSGAMVARNRLISLLAKLFAYALERGHIEQNPVNGIKRTKETSKDRALTDDEIRVLWTATDETSSASPSVRLALRLILVTAQRSSEICQMHESQINGHWWRIPETKNGREQNVYLSDLALSLLEEAKPYSRNGLLLPSTLAEVMDSQILSKAMSRIKWPESSLSRPTPHDLRRTCITGLSCLGFGRLVQDKVANHIDSSVGGIYDRNDYAKEKQQALEAWARKLNEIIHGQANSNSNVLAFRQA